MFVPHVIDGAEVEAVDGATFDLRAPFGGRGESGVGREGGDFSREFFTEPQAAVMAIRGDA